MSQRLAQPENHIYPKFDFVVFMIFASTTYGEVLFLLAVIGNHSSQWVFVPRTILFHAVGS